MFSAEKYGRSLINILLAVMIYSLEITTVQAKKVVNQLAFPIGEENVAYEKYFSGKSYLISLASGQGINVANVTFEPSCMNHWHIHHGSCQILVGVGGEGWYQIWGEEPQKMKVGVIVTIPEGVKHWHGAASNSWFQHLSIMQECASTEWLEPVNESFYQTLK